MNGDSPAPTPPQKRGIPDHDDNDIPALVPDEEELDQRTVVLYQFPMPPLTPFFRSLTPFFRSGALQKGERYQNIDFTVLGVQLLAVDTSYDLQCVFRKPVVTPPPLSMFSRIPRLASSHGWPTPVE
ncbi:hypothetical protein B0H13DRAFT_2381835 [Mycena leptocephala]|nr:hypothetical protein B0H13DRAFT_2381835 [Mycena leptocephala]